MSPLLKFKFNNKLNFALVIITTTDQIKQAHKTMYAPTLMLINPGLKIIIAPRNEIKIAIVLNPVIFSLKINAAPTHPKIGVKNPTYDPIFMLLINSIELNRNH